jgi:hypothetical protein
MPFCRIVRDARGYEYFSLLQPASNRRGKVRQQLLYWFRTPPHVKVGREPFDADTVRALEARNPGLEFDWKAIRATTPPPPEEPWRERRRVERALRQLRGTDGEQETSPAEPVSAAAGAMPAEPEFAAPAESALEPSPFDGSEPPAPSVALSDIPSAIPVSSPPLPAAAGRRRRRRRGRRSAAPGQTGSLAAASADEPGTPAETTEEPETAEE